LTGVGPLPDGLGLELDGVPVPVSTSYCSDRLCARVSLPAVTAARTVRLVLSQGGAVSDLSLVCQEKP
jgi:hypothetical protein